MKKILIPVLAVLLSACASSPYTYHVEPTPLKKKETTYNIAEVNVNLTLGHGANASNERFATQEEVQQQFKKYLVRNLDEEGVLAKNSDEAVDVIVNIDYVRTFNHGGESLNKPEVSHSVTISSDSTKLASFAQPKYTTKYGTFEEIAVNLEITASSWDEEDEPKDIEWISKFIAKDIANVGL
ncbi:hypothetical protein KP803_13300 [Vibrio sp. ZSDE26]|uniref:Lipoprotein n=1 Tax=Vibrio amylolyticus TaxID=2847292 RepID=A0A9X1XKS0_9VIBR|nr:hypothetical protein [Vibrio amylolyticus]MCK6264251.1 hypothetical protein [Vibrio amylolyticus]